MAQKMKSLLAIASISGVASFFLFTLWTISSIQHSFPCTFMTFKSTDGAIPKTKIYIVTSTAKRNAQMADLTRLSQTLAWVRNLHWVVVEDTLGSDTRVKGLLLRSGINFTHLQLDLNIKKSRQQMQQNLGLDWIKAQYVNVSLEDIDAVVYYADDDNSYDVRLFNDYVRNVKTIGIWPVGFPAEKWVEMPNVVNNTVVSWNDDGWPPPAREFAVDMAGFAIHVRMIIIYNAGFKIEFPYGYDEPYLLKQFNITKEKLEPFGFDAPEGEREVLVWHTRTLENKIQLRGPKRGFIV